jgi:hypothetical protein
MCRSSFVTTTDSPPQRENSVTESHNHDSSAGIPYGIRFRELLAQWRSGISDDYERQLA